MGGKTLLFPDSTPTVLPRDVVYTYGGEICSRKRSGRARRTTVVYLRAQSIPAKFQSRKGEKIKDTRMDEGIYLSRVSRAAPTTPLFYQVNYGIRENITLLRTVTRKYCVLW